jgi:hypothetical protein
VHNQQASHASPKLEARLHPDKGGWGVYARERVRAGELLIVWSGEVVTGDQLPHLIAAGYPYSVQVEENLYLVTMRPPETADLVNHCCDPNAGLSGQIALVALRDIAPGEEVCFDYAMSDGSPYDEFACSCGTPHCRGRVTGSDWMRADLWQRYGSHFSPYLLRRIDRLKKAARRQALRAAAFAQPS